MVPIQVVGMGLEGASGLTEAVRQLVDRATLLVGSARHLGYFVGHPADRIVLDDLNTALSYIRSYTAPAPSIVILTSGDPLFFGLGRLLLNEFPAEQLTFHPHLSSVQLAFSRVKLPWQDAQVVSVHGRSLDPLMQAVQHGVEKIAVLTDGTNTPAAIAQLLESLELPVRYRMWVCENLGGPDERILEPQDRASLHNQTFAPLNVVVLQRVEEMAALSLETLPLLGIPDEHFFSFSDRPGLMTKREVRIQVLGELALQASQQVWDIGAGTGSVAIEMARLCPTSTVYAIEKTAIGTSLIKQNCQRFHVSNVVPVHGTAPEVLYALPAPDRVFIGGSGGNVLPILAYCSEQLVASGRLVLALATLEHLTLVLNWLSQHAWRYRLLQVQLSRSVPIASLTRMAPLNPVTLVIVEKLPSR